jgi:uncharacterized protein (DUF924 family)
MSVSFWSRWHPRRLSPERLSGVDGEALRGGSPPRQSLPIGRKTILAMPLPSKDDVIGFWREAGPDRWFAKHEAFDASIRTRFLDLCEAASRGELASWEETPQGALALLILLDQFPRNLFRGSPRAFATDAKARGVAERALARGFDRQCDEELATFLYMPFMHSERLGDQERCVALFEALGLPENLSAAKRHRDIIVSFGRFPHRNGVLGRTTTAEEQRYLDEDGFKG